MKNKIICGDCLKVMKSMPASSIDLCLTDPWYYPANQKTKNAFEDDVFWGNVKKWLGELVRLTKKSGHIFICFSSQKMAKFEFLIAEMQLPLRSRIVWHYRNAGGRCADKGQFGKTYEMVYHIGFGESLNFPKQWGEERFDVWTLAIPQSNFKDKKVHPFQKPLVLFERIVSIGSHRGDTVLDCFIGSGTAAVACVNTGRNFIGIEKEKGYCETAEERIRRAKNTSTNSTNPQFARQTDGFL
jgi:DNA modification methylase